MGERVIVNGRELNFNDLPPMPTEEYGVWADNDKIKMVRRDGAMTEEQAERLVCAFESMADALNDIAKGIAYRPDSRNPSISESMVELSSNISRMADELGADHA